MASLRNGSFDGFITNTIVPKYQLWLKMMKFNNFKFFYWFILLKDCVKATTQVEILRKRVYEESISIFKN